MKKEKPTWLIVTFVWLEMIATGVAWVLFLEWIKLILNLESVWR